MESHSVLDLPHGPGNARNSEGAFITLKDGRILFAYTRYNEGRGGDGDAADIAGLVSSDGGRTWPGEPRLLVSREGYQNIMSVSLLRLPDGRIAMFYLRKNGFNDCRVFLRHSADEGTTWGEARPVTPRKGYYILNNDRTIQLGGGRLLLPIAQHVCHQNLEEGGKESFEPRGQFFVMLSDDQGATWRTGPELWMLPSGRDYLQEPGSVELRDGRIWTFLRTNTGLQWSTFSADGGESWSLPKPSRFESPRAPMSVKRIPSTGHLLAVWDDVASARRLWGEDKAASASVGGWLKDKSWGRTPLAAAISRDEGRTWSRARLLEKEPDHGYCYIAIHFAEDAVLLGYCCGGGETGHVLQDLRIRRVPLKWFYGRGR